MTAAERPTNPMLEAALDAWDNGLCVIRAHTDGSKRPLGEWKRYQSERPTREQVAAWFADGHAGMGAICGAISGDLEMFELEGRLVANDGTKRFLQAMRDAGHELLLRRLINGFYTVSPSGGRHFLYRCTGAIDGNTKLAMNATNEVLIETRGEGGFVVLPPSHGTTHPTGMAWERKGGSFAAIPTITIEERDALFTVARTFDQAPTQHRTPLTPTGTPIAVVQATHRPVGASWMDATVEHLRQTVPMRQLLEHYGWTYSHTDRHGRHLMTRPGKTDGVSGSINTNGRLKVFSTSTPFDTSRTTYDQLDVIAAYEHRGNRIAAGLAVADTAGITRTPTAPTVTGPPPGVNPETGEIISTDDQPATWWLDWETDIFSRTPEDPLVDGLAFPGRWTAIEAPAKAGKSTLAMHIAHTLGRGIDPFHHTPREPVIVAYLDLEMGRVDVHQRLDELDLRPADLVNIRYRDMIDGKGDTLEGGMAIVVHCLEAGAKLVIIDGINGAVGGPENDDTTWRALFEYTIRPLKIAGLAIITTDNLGKDADRGARGSSVKRDKPDAVIRLTRLDDGIELKTIYRRTADYPERVVYEVRGTDDTDAITYRHALGTGYPQGTKECAQAMEALGLPRDIGRQKAAHALREAGHKYRTQVLAAAVKYRKNLSPSVPGKTCPGQVDENAHLPGRGQVGDRSISDPPPPSPPLGGTGGGPAAPDGTEEMF